MIYRCDTCSRVVETQGGYGSLELCAAMPHIGDAHYCPGMMRPDPAVSAADPAVPSSDIRVWWLDRCGTDADHALSKRDLYGSADLAVMGQAMLELTGHTDKPLSYGIRMAIWFYQLGKMARSMDAFKAGIEPADDTDDDLVIYSMMARRVKETGSW